MKKTWKAIFAKAQSAQHPNASQNVQQPMRQIFINFVTAKKS